MKPGIKNIIGKTISGIVVANNMANPKQQMFLIFSDGTYLEFYGEGFSCAGGLDFGGAAEASQYAEGMGARITKCLSMQ